MGSEMFWANKILFKNSLTVLIFFILGFESVGFAKKTLRFTVPYYSNKTQPYFESLAKQFEKKFPESRMQIEIVNWDVLMQKLTTDISAGKNADMAIIGTRQMPDFVREGITASLDNRLSKSFFQRFNPSILKENRFSKEIHGLPAAASARGLFYNKSLFKKAGVSKPPSNWKELLEAAKKLSSIKNIYGFGVQGKEIETDIYFYYALWSYGGEIINKEGLSGLNSPEAIKAANIFKTIIKEGYSQKGVTAYSRNDLENLFLSGRLAMFITGPFFNGSLKKKAPNLKYGIAPIPSGGKSITYAGSDSVIVFRNSKHKDLVNGFLKIMYENQNRIDFSKGEGFLPVLQSVSGDKYFQTFELKSFAQMMANARFLPAISGWEGVSEITKSGLQSLYLGKKSVKEALVDTSHKVNKILKKNKKAH